MPPLPSRACGGSSSCAPPPLRAVLLAFRRRAPPALPHRLLSRLVPSLMVVCGFSFFSAMNPSDSGCCSLAFFSSVAPLYILLGSSLPNALHLLSAGSNCRCLGTFIYYFPCHMIYILSLFSINLRLIMDFVLFLREGIPNLLFYIQGLLGGIPNLLPVTSRLI